MTEEMSTKRGLEVNEFDTYSAINYFYDLGSRNTAFKLKWKIKEFQETTSEKLFKADALPFSADVS